MSTRSSLHPQATPPAPLAGRSRPMTARSLSLGAVLGIELGIELGFELGFALLLFGNVFEPSARAGDWPQFRGPTGQGLSEEKALPVKWGAGEDIRWQAKLQGQGH